MALARAMWTHGHSVRIEQPDRLGTVWRAGFYVRLIGRSAQNAWIHYAIPSPVIVNDGRLRAHSLMVRCRTIPTDAWIAAVHIYDGENRIATHDGLHDGGADWQFLRYDVPGTPQVQWGIGLSINVQFHLDAAATGEAFRIDISSVGCDFVS